MRNLASVRPLRSSSFERKQRICTLNVHWERRPIYVTVVEDRPILSAEYRLPLLAKTDPPCSAVFLQ